MINVVFLYLTFGNDSLKVMQPLLWSYNIKVTYKCDFMLPAYHPSYLQYCYCSTYNSGWNRFKLALELVSQIISKVVRDAKGPFYMGK